MLLDAIRLREAMDAVPDTYDALGTVVKVHRVNSEMGEEKEEEEEEEEEEEPTKKSKPMTHGFFEQLQELLAAYNRSFLSNGELASLDGYGDHSTWKTLCPFFRLDVVASAEGCDYGGTIDRALPEDLLRAWWEKAHVSGFGNGKTQTTDVDPVVRNAREWCTGEIKVNALTTDVLAYLWGKWMEPAHVRVELYKLNVYGPGGKFAAHRDTPETGLVGTILLGLGDTTDAGLRVDGRHTLWDAMGGSFLFFYPDVIHEVLPVTEGYRATLAFKVYAATGGEAARDAIEKNLCVFKQTVSDKKAEIRKKVYDVVPKGEEQNNVINYSYTAHTCDLPGDISDAAAAFLHQRREALEQVAIGYKAYEWKEKEGSPEPKGVTFSAIQARRRDEFLSQLREREPPFGFLLDGRYALGTQELRGADRALYELLSSIDTFRVAVLPVMTVYSGTCAVGDSSEHSESATVYPLTEQHVRFALEKKIVPNMAKACNLWEWSKAEADALEDGDISFVSLDLKNGYKWREAVEQGAEFTGNESRAAEENSVWLHRALVVVARQDDPEDEEE